MTLHGVSDQGAVFDIVLLDEVFDVLGEGGVVVARVVWGLAVVSCVLVLL